MSRLHMGRQNDTDCGFDLSLTSDIKFWEMDSQNPNSFFFFFFFFFLIMPPPLTFLLLHPSPSLPSDFESCRQKLRKAQLPPPGAQGRGRSPGMTPRTSWMCPPSRNPPRRPRRRHRRQLASNKRAVLVSVNLNKLRSVERRCVLRAPLTPALAAKWSSLYFLTFIPDASVGRQFSLLHASVISQRWIFLWFF